MTMIRVLSLSAVVVAFASACSIGPTTKQEVCEAYRELGTEVANATGWYANGVFRDVNVLSSMAGRYEGGTLKADADALGEIADSAETDAGRLENATRKIAVVCGKSLMSNVPTGLE
jgi:hypothetical protein